jgi:ribose/xylose/arabinose/galactoside ABC-type transport system permease subunit
MNRLSFKNILAFSAIFFTVINAIGQTSMPAELSSSPIEEQIKYVEKHTRIYDNFRAIREDIYQKINGNFIDTLLAEQNRITALENMTANLNSKTDSLNALLATTRANLEEATTTKNNIRVLGMELNKGAYNTIMWILVGALAFILALGFLVFKRNLTVLLRTEKDLKELKDEFAAYKQSSRLAREKLEMDNFRAIQKLKGQ